MAPAVRGNKFHFEIFFWHISCIEVASVKREKFPVDLFSSLFVCYKLQLLIILFTFFAPRSANLLCVNIFKINFYKVPRRLAYHLVNQSIYLDNISAYLIII